MWCSSLCNNPTPLFSRLNKQTRRDNRADICRQTAAFFDFSPVTCVLLKLLSKTGIWGWMIGNGPGNLLFMSHWAESEGIDSKNLVLWEKKRRAGERRSNCLFILGICILHPFLALSKASMESHALTSLWIFSALDPIYRSVFMQWKECRPTDLIVERHLIQHNWSEKLEFWEKFKENCKQMQLCHE